MKKSKEILKKEAVMRQEEEVSPGACHELLPEKIYSGVHQSLSNLLSLLFPPELALHFEFDQNKAPRSMDRFWKEVCHARENLRSQGLYTQDHQPRIGVYLAHLVSDLGLQSGQGSSQANISHAEGR